MPMTQSGSLRGMPGESLPTDFGHVLTLPQLTLQPLLTASNHWDSSVLEILGDTVIAVLIIVGKENLGLCGVVRL